MSRDRSESTPSKEARDAAKPAREPSVPPPTAYRSRMSLEKKLGLAFIGVLLTVFFVVLGVRLANIDSTADRVDINLGDSDAVAAAPPPTGHEAAPTILAERKPPNMPGSMPSYPVSPQGQAMTFNSSPSAPPPAFAATAPRVAGAVAPSTSGGMPPRNPPAMNNVASSSPAPTPPVVVSTPNSPPPFATGPAPSTGGANPYRTPLPPQSVATTPSVSLASSMPAVAASSPPAARYAAAPPTTVTPPTAPLMSPPPSAAVPPAATPPISQPPMPPAFAATAEPRTLGNVEASPAVAPRGPGVASLGVATTAPPISSPPPVVTVASTAAPKSQAYVVEPSDSFWSIAEKVYGDGSYYRALFAFNSDRYPHAEDVRTGSVLDVPSVEVLRAKFPELCGPSSGAVAAGGASPAMTGRTNVPVGARTYVVQEGDTLFDIARRQLGKASYWQEIYNLNKVVLGENLDRLQPGIELTLPAIGP